jgi:hypothetical protein
MVGDFQQAIFGDLADLARYRELHELLMEEGAAEELKFSVTFRLDQAQLDFVNATFPEILNNSGGQVQFVELNARPDILPGQVLRLDLGAEVDLTMPELQRAESEAQAFRRGMWGAAPQIPGPSYTRRSKASRPPTSRSKTPASKRRKRRTKKP